MGTGDLRSRLAALPGVLECTVTDDTVALFVHPEVDPRLLKARAQVACAELGETRPLVVVGGLPAPAAARARRGTLATRTRAVTPVSIAVATLFVLSAVALVPLDSDRTGPRGQRHTSSSVALPAPPPPVAPPRSTGPPRNRGRAPAATAVPATPQADDGALPATPGSSEELLFGRRTAKTAGRGRVTDRGTVGADGMALPSGGRPGEATATATGPAARPGDATAAPAPPGEAAAAAAAPPAEEQATASAPAPGAPPAETAVTAPAGAPGAPRGEAAPAPAGAAPAAVPSTRSSASTAGTEAGPTAATSEPQAVASGGPATRTTSARTAERRPGPRHAGAGDAPVRPDRPSPTTGRAAVGDEAGHKSRGDHPGKAGKVDTLADDRHRGHRDQAGMARTKDGANGGGRGGRGKN